MFTFIVASKAPYVWVGNRRQDDDVKIGKAGVGSKTPLFALTKSDIFGILFL